MARKAYERCKRLSIALVAAGALLLVAPAGAWAGSAHYGHRGHHADAGRHHGHHDYQHRSHRSYDRRHRHHAKRHHHTRYYCKPCNHYFDGRRGLYDHVVYRHRVPFWHLANVITFNALGWIFYG